MKKILLSLLVLVLALVSFGYYQKSQQLNGDKWIGIGILILTFLVIPIFLFYRFKNKEIRNRMLNFDLKDKKEPENQ